MENPWLFGSSGPQIESPAPGCSQQQVEAHGSVAAIAVAP